MFDRSLIQECIFEFAVISDTHFMLDVTPETQVEFASRRMQTARIAYALEKLAKLKPEFTLHLGDLVQTFPECPDFSISAREIILAGTVSSTNGFSVLLAETITSSILIVFILSGF